MQIIKTHDVTLYGGYGSNIVLKPLEDKHLPLLYRWNADPEVLYWTEGGECAEDPALTYDEETVNDIYGGVSQNAHCFIIEANGAPIGECWLQKMNIPEVIAMYESGTDVRRIDMAIGEKAWWNRGVGTEMIGMLVNFAFAGENADVLHCFCDDYNARSRRVWEKNGFTLVKTDPLAPDSKGKYTYHFRLTREEFVSRKRVIVPAEKVFMLPINALSPSQLYISSGKIKLMRTWFDESDPRNMDAIPVKRFREKWLMTDGHTRAALAAMCGMREIPCYLDEDELDMALYATDLIWCSDAGIRTPLDLAARAISVAEYERLWIARCMRAEDDPIYREERVKAQTE